MLNAHLTAPCVAIPSGSPMKVVAQTLHDCEGRQLPVMHEGRPIGVVRQEDVDAEGMLRDGHWFGWGSAQTARDVTSDAPILAEVGLDEALRALMGDTVVVGVHADGSLAGVLTEHDAVRIALERLPEDLPAIEAATRPVFAVELDQPACHASQLMRINRIRHVVVTDGGIAVGVVSSRDLASQGVGRGRDLNMRGVWSGRPLIALPADVLLEDAAELLVEERIGALPLFDDRGRPVAVLTRRDIVRSALRQSVDSQLAEMR